jgi:pilus assembly protein CpaB
MKPQTLIMLVVAVGCGLTAMVMTQRFLTAPPPAKPKGAQIVVAAVDIKPGEQINETMIKTVEWPAEAAPANAVADPKEVLGRSVRYPISANEAVTIAKLAAEGVGPGLEPIIESGKRAMSVPIKTHESAAGFIKPGSRVDVVMISRRTGSKGSKAKTILQNVRVIAVNQATSTDPDDEKRGHLVEMVTFLLTPEEAEMLALAQNTGAIQLVMRSSVEDAIVKTTGVTQDELERGRSSLNQEEKPEDGVKVAEGPSALEGFLNKILAKPEDSKSQVDPAKSFALAAIPPPPAKKKLVYRDIQGNVLMEVILDADDKIVDSLDGLLEDVAPQELAAFHAAPERERRVNPAPTPPQDDARESSDEEPDDET